MTIWGPVTALFFLSMCNKSIKEGLPHIPTSVCTAAPLSVSVFVMMSIPGFGRQRTKSLKLFRQNVCTWRLAWTWRRQTPYCSTEHEYPGSSKVVGSKLWVYCLGLRLTIWSNGAAFMGVLIRLSAEILDSMQFLIRILFCPILDHVLANSIFRSTL